MPPPRPPAAGEVLLGYYHITETVRRQACAPRPQGTSQAGCMQCADLNCVGCFMCVFFSFWIMTWPLAFLVCLLQPFHTGTPAHTSTRLYTALHGSTHLYTSPRTHAPTGLQFPVYGYPPGGADPAAWQYGPPPNYQYPPAWTPPPPTPDMCPPQGGATACGCVSTQQQLCNTGFQAGNFPRISSSKKLTTPEPVQGIPVGDAAAPSAAPAAPVAKPPTPQTM